MSVLLVQGTARQIPLRDGSVHCVVTSPPYYGLRDYGTGQWVGGEAGCTHIQTSLKPSAKSTLSDHGDDGRSPYLDTLPGIPYKGTCPRCGAVRVDAQIGGEPLHDCLGWTRQEPPREGCCWVCAMRAVFREVWRVMTPEATLWVNCGDTYAASGGGAGSTNAGISKSSARNGIRREGQTWTMGSATPGIPAKNLCGMPWRLALALQADGFILRSEIIWAKKNCMPESVQDRPTRSHEQVFLFSKQGRYYYDGEAVREGASTGYSQRPRHLYNRARLASPTDQRVPCWPEEYSADDPTTGRAMRSVLSLASEPCHFAHFATMPTALVRKCLLAGAPAQTCHQCSAPWVRQVSRQRLLDGHIPVSGTFSRPEEPFRIPPNGVGHYRYTTQTTEHGFLPTCRCGAPGDGTAVVFDPFCGSGTTLLVARELGHHGVGLDLSYPYLHDIARERLGLAALHRWTNGATPPPVSYGDLPLFAEESV